jgi:hypothetical protein
MDVGNSATPAVSDMLGLAPPVIKTNATDLGALLQRITE